MVQDGYNKKESVDCERCLSFYWKHQGGDELMVGWCRFLKAAIVKINMCYVYNPVRKAKKRRKGVG